MLYDDLEFMNLEPTKYELAQISTKKAYKKTVKKQISTLKIKKSSFILDSLIKSCMICFFILVIFTTVNIIGFNNFMTNLKQIAENRSINTFITNAEFV